MAKTCSESGCSKPLMAREKCSMHYYRWKSENGERCTFAGCGRAQKAYGLCNGHYSQLHRGEEVRALKANKRAKCTVDGCVKLSEAQRLCRTHYYRWKANGDPNITVIAPKGAGCITKGGYRVLVFGGKQIPEHRWVMEQQLGRPLLRDETVHHINGVRDDNRVENLELWSSSHPFGQRVEDKVAWAEMLLRRYAPEKLAGDLT